MGLLLQGTGEKHKGLQVVDVNIDFDTDVLNMGMGSCIFKGSSGEVVYKDIYAITYLTLAHYAYAKSNVQFRDVKGQFMSGEYVFSLNIDTNERREYYTI